MHRWLQQSAIWAHRAISRRQARTPISTEIIRDLLVFVAVIATQAVVGEGPAPAATRRHQLI